MVNSIGGGGAERQISYIAELDIVDKVISIEPNSYYPIPPEKWIILSSLQGEKSTFKKLIQFCIVPFRLLSRVDRQTHLVCFLQLSYIYGYMMKLLTGCTYTISVRTNPWAFYLNSAGFKMPFRMYAMMLQKADYVTTNSKSTAEELNRKLRLKHPAVVTDNGYDIEHIEQQAKNDIGILSELFDQYKVLINVGRLSIDKGQWHLLRVLNELKKKTDTFKLVILGQGPLQQPLVSLSESLGLKTYHYTQKDLPLTKDYDVYFLGFNANPHAYIAKSYLFLFPSLFEGMPNAPIESILCETPCILSDCKSGPREILFPNSHVQTVASSIEYGRCGALLPPFVGEPNLVDIQPDDIDSLWVEAIEYYLQHPEHYAQTKAHIKQDKYNYSIEKAKKQWLDFLSQAE